MSDAPTESMQRPFMIMSVCVKTEFAKYSRLTQKLSLYLIIKFSTRVLYFRDHPLSMARPRATPRIDATIKMATRIASNDLFPEME
jgi:hypothetical protein